MSPAADAAPFAFADLLPHRAPLDRAEHLRGDADALDALWPAARVITLDDAGRARCAEDGAPHVRDGADVDAAAESALFLGLDDEGRGWFAVTSTPADGEAGWCDLRTAAAHWPAAAIMAFATARALLHWRSRTRFCGACGGGTTPTRSGWLAPCAGCGLEHYPRTDPAVIVAVGDGDRLLLGRQRSWPARRYSVIAGFVEPGESLEQTVAREVLEETGVRVRACRYVASQPWPFPSALMLGFVADAEPGAPARAGEELEDARWFTRAEIEAALAAEARGTPGDGPFLLPARISIAHALVRTWIAGRGA
ncbi:NAD(+) diphosphatase [Lysobacter humi (ex Lee et al. 2017)]